MRAYNAVRREILTHITAFTCVPSLLVVQLPRAGGFILLVIKAPPSTLPARMLSHLTYVSGVWDQRSEWKITAGQIDGCGYVRQQGHTSQPRRPAPRAEVRPGHPAVCWAPGRTVRGCRGLVPFIGWCLPSSGDLSGLLSPSDCWRRQVQSPPPGESLLPGETKAPSPKEGDLCWF